MTIKPSSDVTTEYRLAKAAGDAGFELAAGGPEAAGWLRRGAADRRVALWLSARPGALVMAISERPLLDALGNHGGAWQDGPLPAGAVGARAVSAGDYAGLTAMLRRLDQLAAVLPPSPLCAFQQALDEAPFEQDGHTGATETEAVRRVRLGQRIYRQSLLDLWEGRCAMSGLALPALLRASHAKPWAACSSDAERLDVHNGLLLAAHLDAAFDAGLISVADDGTVMVGKQLDDDARRLLGLAGGMRIERLLPAHLPYLRWHREHLFGSQGTGRQNGGNMMATESES